MPGNVSCVNQLLINASFKGFFFMKGLEDGPEQGFVSAFLSVLLLRYISQ